VSVILTQYCNALISSEKCHGFGCYIVRIRMSSFEHVLNSRKRWSSGDSEAWPDYACVQDFVEIPQRNVTKDRNFVCSP
jgi:hypothetical protein